MNIPISLGGRFSPKGPVCLPDRAFKILLALYFQEARKKRGISSAVERDIFLFYSLTPSKKRANIYIISCKEFWFGIEKAAELLMLMRFFYCPGPGYCTLSV